MTIVIVIGLPASGKTTYINSISKNNDKYTDDFISNFFNGVLISKIKEIDDNDDIYINDPRLCNISIFNRYLKIIEEQKNKNTKIKLILFKNDKNKSLENSKKRNMKNVEKSIEHLSNIYDIDNYIHLGYIYEII